MDVLGEVLVIRRVSDSGATATSDFKAAVIAIGKGNGSIFSETASDRLHLSLVIDRDKYI